MKKKTNPLKKKREIHRYTRAVAQIIFFCLFPSAFSAAFNGIKYIFTQLGNGNSVVFSGFLTILLVLCLYTIVFGRFFCGFACAFGSLGDGVRALYVWICKKIKRKPFTLRESWMKTLSFLKYAILFAVLVLCFTKNYERARGYSPWDVFSMLRAGNFQIKSYMAGVLLLLLIVMGMAMHERFFCRVLCPMGAVFAMLPSLPLTGLFRKREDCIAGCFGCEKICPAGIALSENGTGNVSGDCFQCGKCMDICPKQNIRAGQMLWRGNEILYTFFRVVFLAVLLWLAGV
jgi:polyferredoxin